MQRDISQLYELLTYRRPAGSHSEKQMIEKFIDVIPEVWPDEYGNRIAYIGDNVTTMFSCHTDTVHHKEGKQRVLYDPNVGDLYVNHGECLGADDGAGVILMISMIQAGVPGLYVFHREEEIGGKGSSFIANHTPWLLEGIQRCVAFDRKGVNSVITHQGFERCCSDEFALEMCAELGDFWMPDDGGFFTDSANYVDIIPECTNLSIGYQNEHTSSETLSKRFLDSMIEICIQINWESLPTVRDPSVIEYEPSHSWNRYYYPSQSHSDYRYGGIDEYSDYNDILDFVYDNPHDAADMIQEYLLSIKHKHVV